MTTITTDGDALLVAILAAPADDLPRLVYADWLDENPREWVECKGCGGTGHKQWSCKVCGAEPQEDGEVEHGRGCYRLSEDGGGSEWPDLKSCDACFGSGRSPNPARPRERAEFIRVQCELAELELKLLGEVKARQQITDPMILSASPTAVSVLTRTLDRIDILRQRNRDLIITHGRAWGPPVLPLNESWSVLADLSLGWPMTPHAEIICEFRRGFVGSVCCDYSTWVDVSNRLLTDAPIEKVQLLTMPPFEWQISNHQSQSDILWRAAIDALESRWPGIQFVLPTSLSQPHVVTSYDPTTRIATIEPTNDLPDANSTFTVVRGPDGSPLLIYLDSTRPTT